MNAHLRTVLLHDQLSWLEMTLWIYSYANRISYRGSKQPHWRCFREMRGTARNTLRSNQSLTIHRNMRTCGIESLCYSESREYFWYFLLLHHALAKLLLVKEMASSLFYGLLLISAVFVAAQVISDTEVGLTAIGVRSEYLAPFFSFFGAWLFGILWTIAGFERGERA